MTLTARAAGVGACTQNLPFRPERTIVLPSLAMDTTILRAVWDGHPVSGGAPFELRLCKGNREHRAVCTLCSRAMGWELRREVNGKMTNTQVCHSTDDVLGVFETWRNALRAKDWS